MNKQMDHRSILFFENVLKGKLIDGYISEVIAVESELPLWRYVFERGFIDYEKFGSIVMLKLLCSF